ncbi:MAG: hypothetical protein ACO3C1_04600 [Ilumatobacteraceae bacterium]
MARQAQSQLEVLLRVADIRDLAGVGTSAVVTNWRARSPSFPEPRVGGSQPLFELEEILEWLRLDGPRGRTMKEPDPVWLWPRVVEAFLQQAEVTEPRTTLVALVAVRHLLAGSPEWRAVLTGDDPAVALRLAARAAEKVAEQRAADRRAAEQRVADGAEAAVEQRAPESRSAANGMSLRDRLASRFKVASIGAGQLVEVARALDRVEGQTFEQQLAPVLELEGSAQRHRPQRTQPALARLLVAMGRVRPRSRVYDPAAGEGDILVAAAEAAHDDVVVAGQDISAEASFIALTRLAVRRCHADIAEPGDSVRDDRARSARYSVVLLDPPVAARGSSSDAYSLGRWIDHASERLLDRGRLAVVLPLHELASVRAARRRPDQRLQALIESKAETHSLDAVVLLPRGLRGDIVGPLAVLAMTSPADTAQAGSAATGPTHTVPVFAIDGRAPGAATEVVDALASAIATTPRGDLGRVQVDHVVRREVGLDQLWSTLDDLVEFVDPSRASMSRSMSSPSRDDSDSLRAWTTLSRNSARLASLDPAVLRSFDASENEPVRMQRGPRRPPTHVDALASMLPESLDAEAIVSEEMRSGVMRSGVPSGDRLAALLASMVGHAATLAATLRDDTETDHRDRARRLGELRRVLADAVALAERSEGAPKADGAG